MLPGFNHNIRHLDRVFHVQTEDNGLSQARLVTQVFISGQLVALERGSYADILALGLDEREQTERIRTQMQDQHKAQMKRLVSGELDERIVRLLGPAPAEGGDAPRAATPSLIPPKILHAAETLPVAAESIPDITADAPHPALVGDLAVRAPSTPDPDVRESHPDFLMVLDEEMRRQTPWRPTEQQLQEGERFAQSTQQPQDPTPSLPPRPANAPRPGSVPPRVGSRAGRNVRPRPSASPAPTPSTTARPTAASQPPPAAPHAASPPPASSPRSASQPSPAAPRHASQPAPAAPRHASQPSPAAPRAASQPSPAAPRQASQPSPATPRQASQPPPAAPRAASPPSPAAPRHASQPPSAAPHAASPPPASSPRPRPGAGRAIPARRVALPPPGDTVIDMRLPAALRDSIQKRLAQNEAQGSPGTKEQAKPVMPARPRPPVGPPGGSHEAPTPVHLNFRHGRPPPGANDTMLEVDASELRAQVAAQRARLRKEPPAPEPAPAPAPRRPPSENASGNIVVVERSLEDVIQGYLSDGD